MSAAINMTGVRFGRLVGVSFSHVKSRKSFWTFRCDCGNEFVADASNVRCGNTSSCGCLKLEMFSALTTTHGHAKGGHSRTYKTWSSMIQRCTQANLPGYKDYGGRGIRVCDRWRDSFENFLADMGERPAGTSIDRINNDGNYEPGNCRWATNSEQTHNKRRHGGQKVAASNVLEIRALLHQGVSQRSIAERFGITRGAVWLIAKGKTWRHV